MHRKYFLLCRVFSLAFITTIFTMAPNANAASWSVFDDLRSSGIANWSCWASEITPGVANGCEYLNGIHGLNWAPGYVTVGGTDVYEIYGATGWSDVGRLVSVDPYRSPLYRALLGLPPLNLYCKASMKILSGAYTHPDAQLEVIDAASWTYVRTKRVDNLSPKSDWSSISTTTWEPTAKNIFVRIGIIGSGQFARLYINDMTVSCTY